MIRNVLVLIGILVSSSAFAAPQKVALYPKLDIEEFRAVHEVLTDDAIYRALPKCSTKALPCRLTLRGRAPRVYRADQLVGGGCNVNVIFPTSRGSTGRFKIKDGCKVVLSHARALAMAPGLFGPSPEATITFGDLGDALDGIDTEARLARGQKAQRYRWVRAALKKLQSTDNTTRNIRGAVFTETFSSTMTTPAVALDNWIDQNTVAEGYSVFVVYASYVYHNAPPGPACPNCTPHTNQYPIRNEALTGWYRSTDHLRSHWSDAVVVVGPNLGYSFSCAFGGDFPVGTAGDCKMRAKTVSTTAIF